MNANELAANLHADRRALLRLARIFLLRLSLRVGIPLTRRNVSGLTLL